MNSVSVPWQNMVLNIPKFSDRQIEANSVEPDQTAAWSGSTLLLLRLHLLDTLLDGKTTQLKF